MRPIKFRGKSKQGTWFYGDLVRNFCFEPQGDIIACAIISDNDYVQVIPETVGQSTGLHDKNGKEDYFDDILQTYYDDGKTEGDIGVLVWNDDAGTIDLKSKRGQFPLYVYAYHEVIGDIHATPELLEQDNE